MSTDLWTPKQYHIKCRHELGHERLPGYVKWLHEKFPGMELHHLLLSSSSRLKSTDALMVPVTREEHKKAHKNAALYFMINLPKAIRLLIEYVQHLGGG